MKQEHIRPPPGRGTIVQGAKQPIYGVRNLAYTRWVTSHIRDEQRRIYEMSNVAYTRLSTSHIRDRAARRQMAGEASRQRVNLLIIN